MNNNLHLLLLVILNFYKLDFILFDKKLNTCYRQ